MHFVKRKLNKKHRCDRKKKLHQTLSTWTTNGTRCWEPLL